MNESDVVLDRAKVREVTGIFQSRDALDAAAYELVLTGFDRADIDVLTSLDEAALHAVARTHTLHKYKPRPSLSNL